MNSNPLLLFCCFLLGLPLFGQQVPLHSYRVEDGLPSSLVYETHQDQAGFLWICTDKGLARFDGYQFQVYTLRDGLANNDVWGILEDERGRLWLSTFDELLYLEDGKIKNFPAPPSMQQGVLIQHVSYGPYPHLIYLNQKSPQAYYRNAQDSLVPLAIKQQNLRYPLAPPTPSSKPLKKTNRLLNSTQDSIVYTFKYLSSPHQKPAIDQLPPMEALQLIQTPSYALPSPQGPRLIIGSNYLFRPGPSGHEYHFTHSLLGHDTNIERVEYCGADKLLIATTEGSIITDHLLNPIPGFDFIRDRYVYHLLEDRSGNYWISTNQGLEFLPAPARHSYYFPNTDIDGSEILSLSVDAQQRLWLGTQKGGLYRYNEGKFNAIDQLQRPLYVLQNNHQNDLLYGGINGWKELKTNLVETSTIQNQKTLPIKSATASKGEDWYFAATTGVFHYRKNQALTLLDSNRCYALAIDHANQLWMGRTTGLSVYRNGKSEVLSGQHPVYSQPIKDLCVDASGALWIATDGIGLYRKKGSQIDTIHEIQTEVINQLWEEGDGKIWVATNRGLFRIQVVEEKKWAYQIRRIGPAQGLANSEINQVATTADSVFVATKYGLIVLPQSQLELVGEAPVLKTSGIEINGAAWPIQEHYRLKHFQNKIRIDFVALAYQHFGQIRYRYQLAGLDQEWQWTQQRSLEYQALAPGQYQLFLQALTPDGQWSGASTKLTFTIEWPWWQRWWFWLLMGLGITGLVAVLMRWRIQQVRQKAEAESQLHRKFAELELQALQAQMNPHFVFNALQAIQDFIFSKDELVANQYLVKFSRLMRLFLESSKEKYHSLADELDLLRMYLDLEQLRFSDKFTFEIDIAPGLPIETREIPTMIIQPFLENAINHGLIQKKSKGQLWLRFFYDEVYLYCQIEDNGIGRAKAQELKQKSFRPYRSRGMSLVEERRQVLQQIDHSDIEIKITDLNDEKGAACGTRVDIRVQLLPRSAKPSIRL